MVFSDTTASIQHNLINAISTFIQKLPAGFISREYLKVGLVSVTPRPAALYCSSRLCGMTSLGKMRRERVLFIPERKKWDSIPDFWNFFLISAISFGSYMFYTINEVCDWFCCPMYSTGCVTYVYF